MAGLVGAAVSVAGGIAKAADSGGSGSGSGGFFGPSTPPPVPTTYQSTQTLPDWYTGAQQDALSGIDNVSPDVQALVQQGAHQLTNTTDPALNSGVFSSYMDPYTSAVTDNIARLGNENLMENVLPGVNDTFTGAGQFGGDRNADFEQRAIRNNQREISGAQANALETGFNTSMAGYNAGENRAQAAVPLYAQLASAELNPSLQKANILNSMKVPVGVSGVTSGPLPGAGYGPSPAAGLASAASAIPGLYDKVSKYFKGDGMDPNVSGGANDPNFDITTQPMARGGLAHARRPTRGALAEHLARGGAVRLVPA